MDEAFTTGAHRPGPRGVTQPHPRFTLAIAIPLSKEFLREIQRIAVTETNALPVWAENFAWNRAEETVLFTEKEWRGLVHRPPEHRLDLYAIQRGLIKMLDPAYDVSIASRQLVLRALCEQDSERCVLESCPRVASMIVQLALYDQIVW